MSLAESLKACFKQHYPNSDCVLSRETMVDLLTHLDPTWTEDELDTLFGIADKDGNGVIDYNEFVNFICFMGDGDGEKLSPWQLGKAFKESVLDSVVINGDYAIMGATMLGRAEREWLVAPFSEKDKGYEGARKIACIVDLGRPDLFFKKFWEYCSNSALKDKKVDMWIVLMPGTDSDPSFMGSSFGVQMQISTMLCCKYVEDDPTVQIKFVHRDYYFRHRFMVSSEVNDSTLNTLFALSEPDIKVIPESKRGSMIDWLKSWESNVWSCRATVVWGVCNGIEEGEMSEGCDLMLKLLTDSRGNNELPDPDPASSDNFPEEPGFVAYPQAAVRFAYGKNMGRFVDSKDDAWKLEYFDPEKLPQEVEEEKQKEKERSYNLTEWNEAGADIYFFLDVKDLTTEFRNAIDSICESIPDLPMVIVLLMEDLSVLGKVPNLCMHFSSFLCNNVQCVVFATYSEVELVKSVFLRDTYPNATALVQSMVMFPRMMWFTLLSQDGTTCKEELKDSSLLFGSLKYGKDAPTVPAAKLGPRSLMRKGEEAIHFMTVPGDSKATVIQPVDILLRIISMAKECPIDLGAFMKEGETEEEWTESVEFWKSDMADMYLELKQYAEANQEEEDY